MAKANITHDLTIETLAGTAIGFMLAANAEGIRGHQVNDAETIQKRQLTMGELTEAESPPDIALIWSQEDWRLGLGGINHRTDPKKIAFGTKIDTTETNKIRPGRELISTTVDSAASDIFPNGFARVGTEIWAFIGRDVYSWDYTNLNWDIGTEPAATATIYRNGIEFDGKTFAPAWSDANNATPHPYIFKADADCNWTVHPGVTAVNDFKYMAKGLNAAGNEIMWGGYQGTNKHHIRFSTNPSSDTSATWSDPIEIGEADSEITALVPDGDTILVCKTNGVWAYFSNDTVKNITPSFESQVHPDNFRNAFNWNGHILLPLGNGGMYELFQGRLIDVSMDLFAPQQPTIQGQVKAITGDPSNLFILIREGTTAYHLLQAKWAEFQGHTDWRWHNVAQMTPNNGAINWNMFLDSVTGPSSEIHQRVLIAIDGFDSDVQPFFYPLDDDVQDGFTNDTSGPPRAVTLIYDGGFPRLNKAFQSFDANFNNLGAGGRTIVVTYRIDGGSFTSLGTLNETDGDQTLAFTDGVTGKTLELRFEFTATSVTTTAPELTKFRVVSQLRPGRIQQLTLGLYLADQQLLLNGAIGGSVKNDLAQLRTWAGQAAEVTVIDSESTSRDMVFLPGTLNVSEVAHEFGRRSEYLVTARLAEV